MMPDPKKTSVPFSVGPSELAKVNVTALDGRKFVVNMAVVVFDVVQVEGMFGPDGIPAFELRANVAFDVRKED